MSGFPSRKESEYDVFDTGHASNSISIAVGLAEAREEAGESHSIVAVIGDGSLTGGMSFEALNHAGHLKSGIIVVLNDNEMSISKNIGALSSYLTRIMTGEFVGNLREEIKNRLKKLPHNMGDKVYRVARHMEETIKSLVTPGMLFEALGFQYAGPVDGHNLNQPHRNLSNVKRLKGPVLLHVVTKKGKGYNHAEDDPARFHGISTFEMVTGNSVKNGKKTYTDIFGETIIELAEKDEEDCCRHRGHGSRHGPRPLFAALPRQVLRYRHRGTARRDFCRGPCPRRLKTFCRHLLHVPPKGL